MQRTTKLMCLAAAAASLAIPAVASADHGAQITEVSADPRDGADRIELDERARYGRLELRAREAPVQLREVRIIAADGSSRVQRVRRILAPGESFFLDLPVRARIDALVVDYGPQRTDRTAARLEIHGASDERREIGRERRFRDHDATAGVWERHPRRVQRMSW
jgi:hypothetical protein